MRTDPYLLPKPTQAATRTVNPTQKDSQLWQSYQAKKADNRMLFPTEGARLLGVSEFELLLSSPDSAYLGTDFRAVLSDLTSLGKLQNIVRNEFAVHEKKGEFINLKLGEMMGLMINEGGLDLRLFMKRWAFVLALQTDRSLSIGFYDNQGYAINKIFLENNAENLQKWQALCDKYRVDNADSIDIIGSETQGDWQLHTLNDKERREFHDKWRAMTDIHQYHGILSQFELDRASSYHNAPDDMVVPVKPAIIEAMLERLKADGTGVMIFVGSTGMVQIYSGQIHHIKRAGDWINIIDDAENGFNLHLKDAALDQVWFIKRPHIDKKGDKTLSGITMGLEGFDKHGNSIVTFFGERVEGQAQDPAWQLLISELAEVFRV